MPAPHLRIRTASSPRAISVTPGASKRRSGSPGMARSRAARGISVARAIPKKFLGLPGRPQDLRDFLPDVCLQLAK
jgi:hypothetical protein